MKKKIIIVLWLIAFITVSIFVWKYTNAENNVIQLKDCCINDYHGIFEYNDCIDEKCYYGTQLGWRCSYKDKSSQVYLPAKLMNCSG